MDTVDNLVLHVAEKLKEIAVSECMTKDDYEAAYERVYLEFMTMMENV